MKRARAFLVHLAWSVASGALVVSLIAALWYPGALFFSDGAFRLAVTLFSVHAVLGPVLTFAVYNTAKPSLKFDLGAIMLLQLAALAYGVFVAYQSRPVFIVVVHDHAIVVHANEITLDPKPGLSYASLPKARPALVYAELPSNPAERGELLFQVMSGMGDVETRPAYYSSFKEAGHWVIEHARPLSDLIAKHPERPIPMWLDRRGAPPADELVYLPLRARLEEITLILNPADGTAVGITRLEP